MKDDLLLSFAEGLGVFVGVVAGVIVGTLITFLINKQHNDKIKKNAVRALKFELEYNINKVDEFLEELARYKAAVLEGHISMSVYFGYFRFSNIFSAASVQLYQNGFLAEHLTVEQVANLQDAIYALNVNGQQFLNNNIDNNRTESIDDPDKWETLIKQRALNEIRFWDEKFIQYKQSFNDVKNSIS